MRVPKRAVSVVVLRDTPSGPELLAVRRPPDDEELPDVWGLPAASLRPGESWWEAAERVGRDKLGVELAGFRFRREGRAERAGRDLHMRLFEAAIVDGEPVVPQPVAGVTQYADRAWSPPERLMAAAGRGSLCSRLCLAWLEGRPQRKCPTGRSASGAASEAGALPEGTVRVEGVVVRGHRVASGAAPAPPLAGGTIRAQESAFRERGLDLSSFHAATLNLSVAPRRLVWDHPRATFRQVEWHPELPAETFSFSPCLVEVARAAGVAPGWLYLPHPETKPCHRQPEEVVEVITTRLDGVGYGTRLVLRVDPAEVRLEDRPPSPSGRPVRS